MYTLLTTSYLQIMADSDKEGHLQNLLDDALEQKNVDKIHYLLEKLADQSAFLKFCNVSLKTSICAKFDALSLTRSTTAPYQLKPNVRNAVDVVCDAHTSRKDSDVDIDVFGLVEKRGYERVVFFLLQRYPQVVVNCEGDTVLHVVVRERLATLLDLLVYCKWLPDMMRSSNRIGYLPLHAAACSHFHRFFHLFYPPREALPASLESHVPVPERLRHPTANRAARLSLSLRKGKGRRRYEGEKCEVKQGSCGSLQVFFPCCRVDISQGLISDAQFHKSININFKTWSEGDSNLVNSCSRERETCLSLLLEKMTNLCDSVQKLNDIFHMCRLLVRAGARGSYNKRRQFAHRICAAYFELSPLHATAGMGSVENTQLLLDNGEDHKLCLGYHNRPALQLALQNGHNKASLVLLNQQLYNLPDPWMNHSDRYGDTLFHSAVSGPDPCNSKVLERLRLLGCPIDQPNYNDMRPLDFAILTNDVHTINHLLMMKPELVNVQLYQDSGAYPPLLRASSSHLQPEGLVVCKLLLSYGADINACGYQRIYLTAYYRAFKFGCCETGLFLCENSSRPFSMVEREHLLLQVSQRKPRFHERLMHRLQNVPSLTLTCLDVIRQVFLHKYFSFKHIDSLPLPRSMITALRYGVQHDVL